MVAAVTVGPAAGCPRERGGTGTAGRGGRLGALAVGLACAAALTSGCASQAAGDTGGGAAHRAAVDRSRVDPAPADRDPDGAPENGDPADRPAAPEGAPATPAQARAVTGAADVLAAAGSSRVTTAMRMASGGTWLTVTGTGGFDYARRQGALTVLLPKDAIGKEEHKPITELLTPGALYMKNRGAGVPAGKWVRVDTGRLSDGNLVTGGATEPLAAADLLRGAREVTYAGEERVQGVRVRHFAGIADIARAAADPATAVRGPLEAAAKGFRVTRVPFDAWLDSRGRLRRLTESFTLGSDGTAGAGPDTDGKRDGSVTVVSTTTYDRFGVPVPVTLPRPADIWTGKIVSAQP